MSVHELIQTSAQLAQVSQLNALNAHFEEQRRAAAIQANLGQALFETERMAKRVAATLQHDAFAAAVLSYDWLALIQGIHSSHFTDVDHKRAWANAHDTLTSAYRNGQFDPHVAPLLTPYFQNRAHFYELLARVDGDPNAFYAAAQQRHAAATRSKPLSPTVPVGLVIATGGLFFAAVIAGLAEASGAFAFFFMLGFLGAIASILAFVSASSSKAAHRSAQARYEAACRHLEAFSAFMRDPNAGAFLQRIWDEHPLLFHEPIPTPTASMPPSPSVQTFVERKVVERHVVVTRCRFCRGMTPVDGPTCQHCGAPGFGG